MLPSQDYNDGDKLAVIIQDSRLRNDKYGSISTKTVKIQCLEDGRHYIYQASSSLIGMLYRKYGDISFRDAYHLWENE